VDGDIALASIISTAFSSSLTYVKLGAFGAF